MTTRKKTATSNVVPLRIVTEEVLDATKIREKLGALHVECEAVLASAKTAALNVKTIADVIAVNALIAHVEDLHAQMKVLDADYDRAIAVEDSRRTIAEKESLYAFAHPADNATAQEKENAEIVHGLRHGLVDQPQRAAILALVRGAKPGAKHPLDTFPADVAEFAQYIGATTKSDVDDAALAGFIMGMAPNVCRLPLFDGSEQAFIVGLLKKLRAGKTAVSGVVTDMILRALQRGVAIGPWTSAMKNTKENRQTVLSNVNAAMKRHVSPRWRKGKPRST
jgi:hypothetical protein